MWMEGVTIFLLQTAVVAEVAFPKLPHKVRFYVFLRPTQ